MAAIAVKPVISAITGDIEKVTEAAARVEVMAKTIAEVFAKAAFTAIPSAIMHATSSLVSISITEVTTKAVKSALQQHLHATVKDSIGSPGMSDLSKAMTAIPSDIAVNKLAKEAIDKISPRLWVFEDPVFLRLTRLIRTLRAVKKGEEPEEFDDDDCDEEKCRFFKGPEVAGDSEDFIFFSVFGSSECKEGDEVYSMSAQWQKLKSLVDDPVGGHYVSQLFQELFESCKIGMEEGEEGWRRLPAANANVNVVKALYGEMVYFGGEIIYNVRRSSQDKNKSNWLKAFFKLGYENCVKCYIEKEDPVCGHSDPQHRSIVGGHVWPPLRKAEDESLYYYILPICRKHDQPSTYDVPIENRTDGWMKTSSDAVAMKITSTDNVKGWEGKYSHLIGSKTGHMSMAATRVDGAEEPKEFSNWVLDEVHQIALEFAYGPIKTVLKEVSSMVLEKLQEIIKSAGSDAVSWTKLKGDDIMRQSLIPFYEIYQAIKCLSSLHSDAMDRFHSGAQSALSSYKDECLGDEEQKRREQSLVEEIDKVIASKEWKDRVLAFEKTIASKYRK